MLKFFGWVFVPRGQSHGVEYTTAVDTREAMAAAAVAARARLEGAGLMQVEIEAQRAIRDRVRDGAAAHKDQVAA
jgi:hypothetical protein